mmetsp:Transcript_5323/g.21107  ORF Transcript_5323/g.21107 Transcript_5323/m.21107 type:complete len:395 (-) Transcript_5323:47-1231(-)
MRDNLDFEAPILVALGAVLLTAFLLVIPRKKTHPAALESYVGGKKHCLVTGGSGYIGSHTCLALLEAGFEVTVVDNLCNSSEESLRRVGRLTGKSTSLHFFELDLCDKQATRDLLCALPPIDFCIHFAGLKAVGESVKLPLLYYENNVQATVSLLQVLQEVDCKTFVFSSSATVYGDAAVPITEESPVGHGITNAYGRSKFMIEEILGDLARSPEGQDWRITILRYFNPVGAHASGLIGEDPHGPPNNLMPYVSQVAVGRREKLSVFGNDYDTPDGTGVRDYIHVMDLAEGHTKALDYMDHHGPGKHIFNLGTGRGNSVLEMVAAMKKASGREIPFEFAPRRAGDLATVYADTAKAASELGWTASRDIDEMCKDSWAWQQKNPQGYADASVPRS